MPAPVFNLAEDRILFDSRFRDDSSSRLVHSVTRLCLHISISLDSHVRYPCAVRPETFRPRRRRTKYPAAASPEIAKTTPEGSGTGAIGGADGTGVGQFDGAGFQV